MQHGKARFIAGFLALPIVVYGAYVLVPFSVTIYNSFTNWGGFSDTKDFVGLSNYRKLWSDELVHMAFWHNVFFLVALPLITIVLALFLAFLLNVGGRRDRAGISGVRGSSTYKIIFFFPQLLSLVLIAIMWQAMYKGTADGLINGILIKLHLINPDHPLKFVSDPTPFLGVPRVLWWLLLIAVWGGTGFYMVLFSAAMQSIPKDIYEAAVLDGAGRVQSFVRVTLPLLRDAISVAWIYLGFIALDMFALVYVMTPSQGGPNHASETFASVINFTAFQSGRAGAYGYACAIAVALAAFSLVIAGFQLLIAPRERIEF
jgi:N-acetylglucosamine transport system permease protein